jgi:class 3 adenylate cyclase
MIRAATGLPGMALSEEDVRTFEGVKLMMEGGFPYEAMLEGARVLGDSMRRFAETEMRITHKYLHEPLLASRTSEREIARQTQDVLESAVLPVMDPLILAIHRQHLLRFVIEDALLHLEAAERGGPPGTIEAAMLFVDLTSFTSLTSAMGDEAAADVIDRFDRLVRPLVLDHGGTLVKQIGDAFMLAFREPADAVVFSVAFADAALREENFPAIRIGIHFGPVLFRVGDYVGNTVNTASRLSTSAAAGEIVMTEPVAKAAERAEVPVEEVGVRLLRGVSDPLNLYRVIRPRVTAPSRDPVCGMLVLTGTWRLAWEGREYTFCSEKCLRQFMENPGNYAA